MESKACISTSAVTVFDVFFFNPSSSLEYQFPAAQSGTHTPHSALHSAPSLNLLVLVTCSEISQLNRNTCAPYPTWFQVKVQVYHHFSDFFKDWKIRELVTMSYFSSPKILLHPQLPQYYANSVLFIFLLEVLCYMNQLSLHFCLKSRLKVRLDRTLYIIIIFLFKAPSARIR